MGGTGFGVLSFLEMQYSHTGNAFVKLYVIKRRVILIGLFRKCIRITINLNS